MRRRLRPRRIQGKKRPQPRGRAGAEVYREKSAACRHDPDVASQSADPIKFCFRKPESLENREWRACFEPLARDRIWLLADGVWPKKGFNGDGAVVSYLNDRQRRQR